MQLKQVYEKWRTVNKFSDTEERSQINNLTFHLKALEEEQTKP